MDAWRPIPGYEGLYEASAGGRVRGLDRIIGHNSGGTRRWPGRELAQASDNGYLVVTLCRDGVATKVGVHVVVLEAWVGPRPTPEHEGCHGNGNPADNRLGNLRWGTQEDNARDRVAHGRHSLAERDTDAHGHRLAAPNLTTRSGGERGRECLACARALSGATYAARTGKPYDVQAEADRHYAEITAGTARGAMAIRQTCPRSHALRLPNLVASVWREGRRSCLACQRAHSRRQKAVRAGRLFDFQAVSDAIYAEIMGKAA